MRLSLTRRRVRRILALLGNDNSQSPLGPFAGYLHATFGGFTAAAVLCFSLMSWRAGGLSVAIVGASRRNA